MDITKSIVVKGICCSNNHAALWDYNGRSYTWGNALYGRLGHPQLTGVFTKDDFEIYPRRLLSLENRKIFMMAAGEKYTVYLDDKGVVGFFGLLKPIRNSQTPQMDLIEPMDLKAVLKDQIDASVKFTKIASGSDHCLASDTNGKLYSWGVNTQGNLGTYKNTIHEPTMIADLSDLLVIDFACGLDFSIAIMDTTGSITDDKIYSDFKYSNLNNVKNKLMQAGLKVKQELSKQSSQKSIMGSHRKRGGQVTFEQVKNKIERFIDSTDLVGFASLRGESKRTVLNDLIASFLRDEFCFDQFNNDYNKLTQICESIGLNFEQIFYEKIMQDPTVRKENAEIDFKKNIVVRLNDIERRKAKTLH